MNNQSGVYTITHISSGKQYVGSAVNMASRRRDHWKALRKGDHDNSKLQHAWNKYGESAFEFVPLCTCSPEDLTTCEQVAMDHLEPFYNILRVAGSSLGYKHSDEVKVLLSKLRKGKPGHIHTEDAKARIREANTGRIFSPEHLDNLSKSHQGTTASDETRRRMSESHRGFKHDLKSIEKMRKKALARAPFSPEHLDNMSKAQRGKKRGPLSPEHCAKISVALTGKKHAVPRTPRTGREISCVVCGTLKYVQLHRLETAKYCSRACSYEGRRRDYLTSEQTKQKMSGSQKRRHAAKGGQSTETKKKIGKANKVHAAERSALITHCPRGHEYTEANTYHGAHNSRSCRTCARERETKARKRQQLALNH